MSKVLTVFALLVFTGLGVAAFLKKKPVESHRNLEWEEGNSSLTLELSEPEPLQPELEVAETTAKLSPTQTDITPPEADRIALLFNRTSPQLPIVETIRYNSRVDWNQGKSAWLVDYSRHFRTSRHFIARSLNGRADYLKQNVKNGDRINILKPTKDIHFHLVVDLSRLRLWLYYHDQGDDSRVLLKTYPVGVGRQDPRAPSGLLTPIGSYSLGDRVATFSPKEMGRHHGERIEMVQVFGTRWIPFADEINACSAPATGFGIHGLPWVYDESSGQYRERTETLGSYESDGCIRLKTEDVEEIFAIIITRPASIHIAKDFFEVTLPGTEVEI